ncbi:K02A2.6-like, partial [Cordylochernes scorpioides]
MEEGEIVAHIIKGISEDTYQVLVAKDIQTVDEILKFCRHLTTVKQRRIVRTKFARLSNVMSISCVDDSDDLAGLIRRIVREEIQKVFSAPEVINPLREVNALEQTVREEVSRALQPTRPQVNVVQQQPRTPYYNIDRPTQPKKTEHWRTYDDKPICFHCGRPGHVVRYCRERRQVFAEARTRNGGEGRNVGFSSRPPRYDADDDYVTPQTSTYFYRSSSPHPSRARSPARRQSQSPTRRFSHKFRRELKTPLFKEPGPILKAANKNLIETLGKCVLNIEVNGLNISFDFVVMVECSHDIIFGWDFFKATEAVIDCGRNELHLGETSVLESREEENQRLFASEDFVIPPKSIKKISVINEEICGVRDVFVSTSKDLLLRKEVLLPNSLVTFRHGRGSIWVANGASWPQLIPSGMNMCTMESHENGNICSLIESSDKLQETQLKSREWSQKINLTLDPGLSEIQRLQLVSCLDEFIDIFDFGSTLIKPTSTVKHKNNTGDHSPIKQRPYRVAPSERRLIQDEVNKMIENHIVKPSESPWSSPVILVRKKDGTWRFCVDYDGLYEFQVMPFGLCNAPATYERMIDSVLGSLKWNMCLCYLDDIVVYAPTFEEHLRRLQLLLSCIQKAGLSLNHKKCLFGSRRIKILGHLVDANGIHPGPDKVEAVSKFPRPRNISELRSFLGLCSYYRRFIENFADKARSLHDLLKTEKQFYWDAAQEKAFEVLKTALISEPVLGHFDESADTHLHTDASGHGIGAVLLQIQGGKERPIAYASRSLTKAENNYSTTEKECLAVVWSISKFRPYLFGRPFTVVTDHHSLCWLTNGLTGRFNKTLGDMLSMYTGAEQKDWDQVLPYVTFAYNTARQEATGYTPFFLVHAREAETYIDAVLPYLPDEISDDYVGELVTRAEEARQLSRSRLLQSQAKDRRLYDQKHTPVYYQKDDLVWVFTPIRKVGLSEKLLKRYFGPYKVTKKFSEVTYEVEPVDPSPRSRKSKDIVHVIRMKPYLDPEEQHSVLLGNTGRDRFPSRKRLRQANQRVAVFSKEGVMSSSPIQMGQLSIIPGPRGGPQPSDPGNAPGLLEGPAESATEALRAFRSFKDIRSGKGPMSCYSLKRLIKSFEETGSLEAKPRSGRPSTCKSVAVTVLQNAEAIETLSTYGE